MNSIEVQDQHCDYTRGTEKSFRVLRNIGKAAPYFPINEPILCFGSGDGFEIQVWKLLGFDVIGCEISSEKRKIAKGFKVKTFKNLYNGLKRNVYCAHTIEHVENRMRVLSQLYNISVSTICLIFPIEPNGSMNPSHLSPVQNIEYIKLPGKTVLKYEHWNNEREGIIIFKKDV